MVTPGRLSSQRGLICNLLGWYPLLKRKTLKDLTAAACQVTLGVCSRAWSPQDLHQSPELHPRALEWVILLSRCLEDTSMAEVIFNSVFLYWSVSNKNAMLENQRREYGEGDQPPITPYLSSEVCFIVAFNTKRCLCGRASDSLGGWERLI